MKSPRTGRPILPASIAVFHSPDRLVPTALADHAELDPGPPRRGDHRVAIGEARGQRLFDQDVNAGLGRLDRRLRRGADAAYR